MAFTKATKAARKVQPQTARTAAARARLEARLAKMDADRAKLAGELDLASKPVVSQGPKFAMRPALPQIHVTTSDYASFKLVASRLTNPGIVIRAVSSSDVRLMAVDGITVTAMLTEEPTTLAADFPNVLYRGANAVTIDTPITL